MSIPRFDGVLETALYVEDLPRSVAWYERVLGCKRIFDGGDRLQAMSVLGKQVLLLFRRGATDDPVDVPGGRIPGHGGSGAQHLAFAISEADVEAWRLHLEAEAVQVVSEVAWDGSGRSLYFRDPDGHLLEVITPGFWKF